MAFSASADSSKCEMNVVPLIDVLLVLLIIFMVATPTLSHSLPLTLPQPVHPPPPPPPEQEPLRLRIDAYGQLFREGAPVAAAELEADFIALVNEATHRGGQQRQVQLASDADTPYQALTDLLAQAHNRGVLNLALADID